MTPLLMRMALHLQTSLTAAPGGSPLPLQRRMGFYLYNGPNGETGFYSTYASDFKSANNPTQPDAINMIAS